MIIERKILSVSHSPIDAAELQSWLSLMVEEINDSLIVIYDSIDLDAAEFESQEDAIAANAVNIATNAANIASNAADIASNALIMDANSTAIAGNISDIASNAADIITNAAAISDNAIAIALNTTNISNNTSAIDVNTIAITSNAADIATNASSINTNAIAIANNIVAISNNATNIASNTVDIATNAINISSNTTAISNNAAAIAVNVAAIAVNAAAIADLESFVPYFIDWDSEAIVLETDSPVGGVEISRNTRKEIDISTIITPNGDTLDNYSFDVSAVIYEPEEAQWGNPGFVNRNGTACKSLYKVGVGYFIVFATGDQSLHRANGNKRAGSPFTDDSRINNAYCRARITLKRRL